MHNSNTQKIYSRQEKCLTLLFCSIIAFPAILSSVILALRQVIVLPYKLDTMFLYCIYAIIIFLSLRLIVKRFNWLELLPAVIIVFYFVVEILLNSNYTSYYLTLLKEFLLGGVLCYIVCRCLREFDLAIRYLRVTAFLITACEIIVVLFINQGIAFGYSQSVGYSVLPAAAISIDALFDAKAQKKVLHLLNIIVSFGLILSAGARGPVLCIILLIGLKLFILVIESKIRAVITIGIIGGLVYVIMKNFNGIISYLRDLFVNLGMSTRLINRLLEGSFANDTARSKLADYSLEYIQQHLLIGSGIGNDRIYLAEKLSESDYIGWYPHNIFLELPMQFGVLLGLVLIIALTVLLIRATINHSGRYEVNLSHIFITIGFFPLLVSGSYISEKLFFCLLALCLNIVMNNQGRTGTWGNFNVEES